jgi:hypothetical protein
MAFNDYHGAMFGRHWKTSARRHGVANENDVGIPMSDGTRLSGNLWRPDTDEKVPVVLGVHGYHPEGQTGPITPSAISSAQWRHATQERTNASLESGDPNFFARRGYAHMVLNVRGTGRSQGEWQYCGPQEVDDIAEAIQWLAARPWCDGNVVMFGVSYFARMQLLVATRQPPALKALFCPWGNTDLYRDICYRGGILHYLWPVGWSQTSLVYGNVRPRNHARERLGEEGFRRAIAALLDDDDIRSVPQLVSILKNPDSGANAFVTDILLHPLHTDYWDDRTVDYAKIRVPAYIGACWGNVGIHLPAAFRSWERLDVPKKMIVGPPIYLDRPVYQLQHEAVRWFDHWVKGVDTGIMDEPPVRLFMMNTGEWKESDDWPLPETKWTPFYLHADGLLSEHEHWPFEGNDSFEDSPWMRGHVQYATPPLVENTQVAGPVALKLYAASTDTDIHWVVTLLEIDAGGNERFLTRGWLKASHRRLDMDASKPWEPIHTHLDPEPLTPGEIYEFDIKIVPTANEFKAGSRIAVKISCAEDPPADPLQMIACGSLRRARASRIGIFRNEDYPSYLLLPITKGNLLNTFFSGGRFPERQ